MSIRRLIPALALAAAAAAPNVHAETFAFNAVLPGPNPTTVTIGTLTVTQSGADLLFSLSVPGLDSLGASSFLGAIGVDGVQAGQIVEVSGGAPVRFHPGGGPNGVDFRFDLTQGQQRLVDGETVAWTWKNAGQTVGQLRLSAHVQSIGATGESMWVSAGPVPEPETYTLALAGLGVAGWLARSRSRARRGA